MKNPFRIIAILITLSLFSCKEKHRDIYEIIHIDVNASIKLDIRDSVKYNIRKIPLELTDNSLLTHIEQIEIKDNKIFVYDKHRLIVFDKEGVFLHGIGKMGSGPGEYTNINSFFFQENNVCIYDDNLQTLFTYNEDGIFITSRKTDISMASIYPINNNQFIGRKKYQGDRVKIPTLAILDENLSLVSDVTNRFLTSGIGVFDYCYSYEDDILYWEFLNDTIYSIKEMNVVPRYDVDFQKNKVPSIERENKEIGEIIEYINSNSTKLATGIRYVQEDISDIRFIFIFQEKMNYAKYSKGTKKTSLCHFYDSKEILQIQYFMKYNEGNIILSVYDPEDDESNPILLFIGEENSYS